MANHQKKLAAGIASKTSLNVFWISGARKKTDGTCFAQLRRWWPREGHGTPQTIFPNFKKNRNLIILFQQQFAGTVYLPRNTNIWLRTTTTPCELASNTFFNFSSSAAEISAPLAALWAWPSAESSGQGNATSTLKHEYHPSWSLPPLYVSSYQSTSIYNIMVHMTTCITLQNIIMKMTIKKGTLI